jgi:glucose-6-phosphate-specific signal transduction histidine kinase
MNLTIFSYILLAMFAISVVIIYMYVRRGQINTMQGLVYGGVADVIIVTLFSLSAGNDFLRAVLIGMSFGIIFNSITALAAGYFRRNERTAPQAE